MPTDGETTRGDTREPGPGQPVSDQLEAWLTSGGPTTLGSLATAFGDEILAMACLVLMAPSALPIPTGGATHVFAVLAFLCAGQLALGRRSIWIPARWSGKDLGSRSTRFISVLIRVIRRCERWSRPRFSGLLASVPGRAVTGLVLVAFIVAAFFSPPFSGLDTLPSTGVVLISLGLLLGDAAFVLAGLVIGAGGITLSVTLGAKLADYLGDLF